MPYDPAKRGGWAKGLIHFHTDYSDGKASVQKAAEMAAARGYDFLVITDHLQDLKLKKRRRFEDYVAACDAASQKVGILVVPGGEFEVQWQDPLVRDRSEAHTLTISVRSLVREGELTNADPKAKPYDHWTDSQGRTKSILAVQEKLRQHNLPVLASHQFQHSLIRYGEGPEHPDFRYDLQYLDNARAIDFFYSGVVDVAHESDDFVIYEHMLTKGLQPPPCVYASCDFHIGPEIWFEGEGLEQWTRTLARLALWLGRRNVRLGAEVAMHAYFAPEQLSHATYVWLGEQTLTEETLLEAITQGRTFVTRGEADVEQLSPPPGADQTSQGYQELRLRMSKSFDFHRPRVVFVLRDGDVVHKQVFSDASQIIDFGWVDWTPGLGRRHYVLYIPSKLITSPIFVEAP